MTSASPSFMQLEKAQQRWISGVETAAARWVALSILIQEIPARFAALRRSMRQQRARKSPAFIEGAKGAAAHERFTGCAAPSPSAVATSKRVGSFPHAALQTRVRRTGSLARHVVGEPMRLRAGGRRPSS